MIFVEIIKGDNSKFECVVLDSDSLNNVWKWIRNDATCYQGDTWNR